MIKQVDHVTQENFDHQVLAANRPVLVDFYADWCGPCKAIARVVADLASEYEGQIEVRKVDVDQNAVLAGRFGIRSIPTLMLFKDGEPVDGVVGAVSKQALEDMIERNAA